MASPPVIEKADKLMLALQRPQDGSTLTSLIYIPPASVIPELYMYDTREANSGNQTVNLQSKFHGGLQGFPQEIILAILEQCQRIDAQPSAYPCAEPGVADCMNFAMSCKATMKAAMMLELPKFCGGVGEGLHGYALKGCTNILYCGLCKRYYPVGGCHSQMNLWKTWIGMDLAPHGWLCPGAGLGPEVHKKNCEVLTPGRHQGIIVADEMIESGSIRVIWKEPFRRLMRWFPNLSVPSGVVYRGILYYFTDVEA